MTSLFCFGLGYVAQHLANKHPFWRCMGTKQAKPLSENRFSISPYETVIFNEFQQFDPTILDKYNQFLISIPPIKGADLVLKHYQNYFKKRGSSIRWVGYLSATNVYGDHDGAWVDETATTNPTTINGRARLEAEKQWLSLYEMHHCPVHIFRLSSIYGPDRSPLEKILYGKVTFLVDKTGHFFSRIHLYDICRVLQATLEQPRPGQIFNLADDLPAEYTTVMEYAYALLGELPPPKLPLESAKISPAFLEYFKESKRIKNSKIKQELGISLLYPTYREGFQNCLDFINDKEQKNI
ncbi:SDR family oxidoreductase [Candidatus Paracaedibacter symbiosus]|uniref:SDR family oxidoreductase n=1 Tax=Candidatus Paracaedibacter symbiosus TaxID=244582 RepID=UPI0005097EC0|nr:SDR family oxidoreductase [Candidatus Paracaedibacter symbiosus]